MRASIGACRGDPIVVRFFEAFECPRPGLESTRVFGGILNGIRPIWVTGLRLNHGDSFGRNAAELYQDEREETENFRVALEDRSKIIEDINGTWRVA
jgi:hypothetical protein